MHSIAVSSLSLALASVLAWTSVNAAETTPEEQQPEIYPIAADAAPPQGLPFNLALPADFNRCHQTAAIADYLDTLDPADITSLTYLKLFLTDCQRILEKRVAVEDGTAEQK